jgi:hypothetical protein
MHMAAYIPGEGQHVDMHIEINSLDYGVVRLWVLIDDEVLLTWSRQSVIDRSDAGEIVRINEQKLFQIITNAIRRGESISPRGGPFRVTKRHLH